MGILTEMVYGPDCVVHLVPKVLNIRGAEFLNGKDAMPNCADCFRKRRKMTLTLCEAIYHSGTLVRAPIHAMRAAVMGYVIYQCCRELPRPSSREYSGV